MEVLALVLAPVCTLAAALGSYSLAGRNERRRDDRAAAQENERDSAQRRAKLNDFQLDTILQLQDGVQVMSRLTGRAIFFDYENAREGRYTQLPPALSEECYENAVAVRRLNARILNDDVRAAVVEFAATCVRLSALPTRFEGRTGDSLLAEHLRVSDEMNHAVAAVNSALGEEIRSRIRLQGESL